MKKAVRMKDEVATGQRLQRAMENTGLSDMVVQMIRSVRNPDLSIPC